MMGVTDLLHLQDNPSQALRPSVVTGNGAALRSSLGIALRNVRSCGRVPPISAGQHLRIAPEGRSFLRSEPSSRTALMGEQPNPWELLHPQDAMSRHRGAKPPRRCGLLGEISLLSPG